MSAAGRRKGARDIFPIVPLDPIMNDDLDHRQKIARYRLLLTRCDLAQSKGRKRRAELWKVLADELAKGICESGTA